MYDSSLAASERKLLYCTVSLFSFEWRFHGVLFKPKTAGYRYVGLLGSFWVRQSLNYISTDLHNLIWRLLAGWVIWLHPVTKFKCLTNMMNMPKSNGGECISKKFAVHYSGDQGRHLKPSDRSHTVCRGMPLSTVHVKALPVDMPELQDPFIWA